jgi:hypothetical protein
MPRPRISREAAKAYKARGRALRALGFPSYEAYLASSLWRETIRPRVLKAAGGLCCACGAPGCVQVHHECYSLAVLAGEDDSKLHVVCDGCHDSAHHFGGLLLGPSEATARLREIRRKRGLTTP